jgi:hypothetical protein
VKLRSLRASRLSAGAATAALIGAAMLAPASAAHAASEPPTISGMYCDSWGANQFFCSISISGGITPYTSYWSGSANVATFGAQNQSYTLGTCTTQGVNTTVYVLVRDGYGYTNQASFEFVCA